MRSALIPSNTKATTARPARNNLPLLSLPGLCCEAAGSDRAQAAVIATAWRLLYEAAYWLDQVQDGEIQADPASGQGPGPAINIAIGLMTSAGLALCALEEGAANFETARAIRSDFYRTGLKMCAGQHADLTVREPTLEHCWQIAEAKSGEFFALACRAGARLADDDAARLERFSKFGYQLGVLIQIGDDLSGLGPAAGERSDLATGQRWTLPVAYAMSVLPAREREQLRQQLKAAPTDVAAEAEVRRRLIESGAVLYLIVEAERHRRKAEAALLKAAPPSRARDELLTLLNEVASLGQP